MTKELSPAIRAKMQALGVIYVRLLSDEYFVAVTLKPSGNLGKARFLLHTRSPKLLADLI